MHPQSLEPREIASGTDSSLSRPLFGFAVAVKRFLVIASAIVTAYFAIGTWMFPEWYFGIFWGGKFWDEAWWASGVSYWLDLHTVVLALAVFFGFVLVLVGYAIRRLFLPFVDRYAFRLVFGLVVTIFLTALLDYKYARSSYLLLEDVETAVSKLNSAMQTLYDLGKPPTLQAPIDFQFLDRSRVEALYNQLEPELIEKQRTITGSESARGRASVTTGGIGGEIGATKEKGSTSSFERASFSPERKCFEVMRFTLEHNKAHYYSDGGMWFLRRIGIRAEEEHKRFERENRSREVTHEEIEKLRLRPFDEPPTKEEKEESDRRVKESSQEFETELRSLNGLVILDATFDIRRSGDGSVLLVEKFSDKPRRVFFHVTVNDRPQPQFLPGKTKARLRVFGTVIQPLGDDGTIDVRAIAIY